MTHLLALSTLLALTLASGRPDTVRYSYSPQDPVKTDPVIIIDGVVQAKKFDWSKDIDTKSVSRMNLFTDSLTCAKYGGEAAVKEGLVYVITKKNADKIEMPVVPPGARPAKESKFLAYNKDPWSVECGGQLDELPSFGKGDSGAFFRWLTNAVMTGRKDYMGSPTGRDDYGPTEVSFIITEDGKVEDVKVLLKRTDRFNSAVTALVNDSPAWKPAQKDGRPVPVVVIYPVWAFLLIM